MIAGHEEISGGDILLGSNIINDLPPAKRGTAMMFQNYALFPHLSCLDNVAFALKMRGIKKNERYDKSLEILKLVQMENYSDRYPNQLSGGQQQRVALARALITSPTLLLLDEPSAGLSPVAINEVFTSIKEINTSGVSILLVEQNAKRALSFSDRGYVLDHGRNAYQGKGEELLNDSRVIDLYLGKL